MPILSQRIFDEINTEKAVCITGVLSGGKTRLAFDLALPYWRSGKYRVISNCANNFVGNKPITSYQGKEIGNKHLFKTFIVLDEGGEYVRTLKIASLITRSAGKADYYVVFAGKKLPHKELQGVVIRPRFNFYDNFGLPFIWWSVKVASDVPYKFSFIQWFPSALHGTYSTLSSSAGIEDIISLSSLTVDKLAEIEGQIAGKTVEAGLEGFADDLAGSFDALE